LVWIAFTYLLATVAGTTMEAQLERPGITGVAAKIAPSTGLIWRPSGAQKKAWPVNPSPR
jgi:hypothetical protein